MSTAANPTHPPEPATPPSSKVRQVRRDAGRPGGRPRRTRRRAWPLAIGVVAAALLAGLTGWWLLQEKAPAGDITATVARGELPVVVTERGELESSNTLDARCEVEGRQIKII